MDTIGILPGERLAGLSVDHYHKLQHGGFTLDEWALFLQRRNPFAFEPNEHGHMVITITGLDLTGAQEIDRLEAAGYRVSKSARSCVTSVAEDGYYDKKHRLVAGQEYKIALVPGEDIEKDSDRTIANLRDLGMNKYGYGNPLAGFIPRIREVVSDRRMKEMRISYITALHDLIKDSEGDLCLLNADRRDGGRWFSTFSVNPEHPWVEGGAFVFPVIAAS